ncbi:MAG: DUF1778 domain-containing protein [Gammaproteobacteria bacterium]|nr:DUF1778 domain-containing protein [Gammaproteobacteria bacterium]MCH9716491.1 DUF1778 domain-containing protein [Gammaproteobacteria bacterium]MCH9764062.1 DUF1778 domain-containing protein [Gammaproteobacteria bacterium]
MTQTHRKNSAINLRALPEQKKLIDMAASLSHKNRSDFMLEAACREAENVLLDQRLFLIEDDMYKAFVTLLEQPVNENFELQALLKSRSPWEK